MWFGGESGLSLYDGQKWTRFAQLGYLTHEITSLAQGSDGTIWVGTPGGIARFDGIEWTFFPIPDVADEEFFPSLTVAPDGMVWIWAPPYRLYQFDGQTFTLYTDLESVLAESSAWSGSIVADDEGNIWIANWGLGLYRFQP